MAAAHRGVHRCPELMPSRRGLVGIDDTAPVRVAGLPTFLVLATPSGGEGSRPPMGGGSVHLVYMTLSVLSLGLLGRNAVRTACDFVFAFPLRRGNKEAAV